VLRFETAADSMEESFLTLAEASTALS